MIWQTLQNPELGCNSYLVGDEATGRGLVVDPLGALGASHYVLAAQDLGIDVEMVVETHVHADHASCAHELSQCLRVPHGIGQYAPVVFPHEDLKEGQVLDFGMMSVQVWETPGHTPDSISLIIRDLRRGTVPWVVLSGDSLFVGDVGRPDLADADKAAIRNAARRQYASVRRLMTLPDGVKLWPAHYGSSPCGGIFMNKSPHSTIGYERQANPFVKMDEDAFVEQTLRLLKPPPQEAAKIRQGNLTGTL